MKKLLYFALSSVALFSCSQNEPLAYVDNPAIYIASENINYSFFYSATDAVTEDAKITVHAMGNPSSVDRTFSLVQSNNGEDAATAGLHYTAFDSDVMKKRMVMPAGKSEVVVPITLLKDASLDTKTVKLVVKVADNENFKVGVIEKDSTIITFSSQAIKPNTWDDWYYAFGANWGSVKMRFIIDNTGITNFDKVPTDVYYLIFLNTKLKQKLYEYNMAHPDKPLQEADGTYIDFENPYRPS